MSQQTFNPINFGFTFTDDGWYTFDRKTATKAALQARNAEAKKLTQAGRIVRKWSSANQLISKGGIGSGRPHIEEVVTVYGFNVEN